MTNISIACLSSIPTVSLNIVSLKHNIYILFNRFTLYGLGCMVFSTVRRLSSFSGYRETCKNHLPSWRRGTQLIQGMATCPVQQTDCEKSGSFEKHLTFLPPCSLSPLCHEHDTIQVPEWEAVWSSVTEANLHPLACDISKMLTATNH